MNKNLILLAALTGLAAAGAAQAYEDDDVLGMHLQFDSKVSAGVAWRVESREASFVGRGNGGRAFSTNTDDGNLAFESGEVVSSAFKITSDLTLSRGDWGVFARGSYLLNDQLKNHDFFNACNYAPQPSGCAPRALPPEAPQSEFASKTGTVRDAVGNDADLLDVYLFGTIPLGFTDLGIRVGRQVINWGESTFVTNGINSILAADANQLRVPGFELDEVLIPTGNVWISASLFAGMSLEAFYQFDWRPTVIDASGTFWSTNDFAGTGGTRANLRFGLFPENTPGTTTPRVADRKPDSDGQFGARLGMLVPILNDIEMGLYAMKYHSRLPVLSGTSANVPQVAFGSNYFVEYPEDIQLYGWSFNTTVGDWSVQGEYSYKIDQPLQVDDVELLLTGLGISSQIDRALFNASGNKYLRGWRRHDISQVDIGVTGLFGPWNWLGNDQLLVLGEVAGMRVHDLPSESELYYEGPGTYKPGANSPSIPVLVGAGLDFRPGGPLGGPQTEGYATSESYGYKLVARLTYHNVFNLFTIEPTLRFDHDFKGISPAPVSNFVEDRIMTTFSVGATYLQAWQAEVGYTMYSGAGAQNLLQDRDFVSAFARYSF